MKLLNRHGRRRIGFFEKKQRARCLGELLMFIKGKLSEVSGRIIVAEIETSETTPECKPVCVMKPLARLKEISKYHLHKNEIFPLKMAGLWSINKMTLGVECKLNTKQCQTQVVW
jgi:hypothetical protein